MARIIIVDDYEEIQNIIKDRLEKFGSIVDLASNSEEAFLKIKNAHPPYDILITDYEMPILNGVALIHRSLKEKILPENVLILSSVIEMSDEILKIQNDHPWIRTLSKPFFKDDLEKCKTKRV